MYDSEKVAVRIKQRAKEMKVTLKEMLPACGLGINAVSTMSSGMVMASDSLARIADYLDCSVDYLLGRTDNPEAHKK